MENEAHGNDLVDELRASGRLLPVHQALAFLGADVLDGYCSYSDRLIFNEEERFLTLRERFLVLLGVMTAVGNDPHGIRWASEKAQQYGASTGAVLEACAMAALPAGLPRFESVVEALVELGVLEGTDVHVPGE
jgi:alkylhydroperoxidase/carboxymuconolactone decarboxylase family protein YurZ